MPAHPGRSAFAEPGTSSEGWSPATLPVWRAGDENRAPDTLVEATFSAIADAGSIPAVSTGSGRTDHHRTCRQIPLLRAGFVAKGRHRPVAGESSVSRSPGRKRSLAMRELGLGVEALFRSLVPRTGRHAVPTRERYPRRRAARRGPRSRPPSRTVRARARSRSTPPRARLRSAPRASGAGPRRTRARSGRTRPWTVTDECGVLVGGVDEADARDDRVERARLHVQPLAVD